ncbi:XRE family transcriptional regulator [Paracoccus sediminis]|uniref:Transcriptional regulator, XRE family with cupin sensor n=1 Tax=Paracoccus sediminis TaxID=1214787 RepID=A0A238YGK6_9RHOB|nr:XRE family transcriptional regulator [Paracoccus sediminis]TBN46623.1 XRE family transcriptional regulator [Paracoccus sediminis]SNR69754.1 transcriptional regulator, XRE family with cupin sensor [Paracoccus sediminis]
MSHHIGGDIRSLRKSRGMTIQGLSRAVGRSMGWLSQIERGRTTPSVQDLGQIADHLGVGISFFFRSASRAPQEQGLVLRAADRTAIGTSETGLVEELLSPTLGGSFEMIRSTFAPRSSSGGPRKARPSEDGGVVLSGTLTLTVGDAELVLEPGDSFQFAQRDYAWRNDADEPAVVVWIVSPPIY